MPQLHKSFEYEELVPMSNLIRAANHPLVEHKDIHFEICVRASWQKTVFKVYPASEICVQLETCVGLDYVWVRMH